MQINWLKQITSTPSTPPHPLHYHPTPTVVFLLTVPRPFFCCSSYLLVCLWFQMWCLFCPYLFLISPSFGASEGLCSKILAFPGYLHLYFYTPIKSLVTWGIKYIKNSYSFAVNTMNIFEGKENISIFLSAEHEWKFECLHCMRWNFFIVFTEKE